MLRRTGRARDHDVSVCVCWCNIDRCMHTYTRSRVHVSMNAHHTDTYSRPHTDAHTRRHKVGGQAAIHTDSRGDTHAETRTHPYPLNAAPGTRSALTNAKGSSRLMPPLLLEVFTPPLAASAGDGAEQKAVIFSALMESGRHRKSPLPLFSVASASFSSVKRRTTNLDVSSLTLARGQKLRVSV